MYDLTRNIFNTSQLAVACGGFSDVFVGDLVLPKMNDAFIAPISCKVIGNCAMSIILCAYHLFRYSGRHQSHPCLHGFGAEG